MKLSIIGVLVAGVGLVGCSVLPPVETPTPSVTPSGPQISLSQPGAAATVVGELVAKAGTNLAIRLVITDTTASMTFVQDDKALTLGWEDGVVQPVDSDITYVGQAIFAVDSFTLTDVGQMFAEAAALTGSSAKQELQINEYNTGKVLMTVTTSPESQTIFFRQDATIINWLSFETIAGVSEALRDVATGSDVIAVGLNDQGLYADARVDPSTIERIVRPAKLPAYSALRSASSDLAAFNPDVLDATVLASLLAEKAPALSGNDEATATWVIDTRDNLGAPTIRLTVGLTTRVYDLTGTDITDRVA
ncbi:MAG: hypothetical protein FWF36_04010 [Propionibacteriaceae bacterium]|nr:hypothetical protein [Propionibacteriaceae bacterium]